MAYATKSVKVAIAYDFDGTLARGNIQENSFLPELGISKEDFWKNVHELAEQHEMDEVLAYMYLLIAKARERGNINYTRHAIKEHGREVKYFNGVESWFTRINGYAEKYGVQLEHYVISSGNKEMIEGTSIAKYFKVIYASAFKFDGNDVPEWPALAVNYTNKTQYLFRINKGIKNAWDNTKVNNYMPDSKRYVLFPNMIYLGDGLTDVPAMKMINYQGGHSIALYAADKSESKNEAMTLVEQGRAKYAIEADYSAGRDLERVIQELIAMISARERISGFGKTLR